MTKTEVNALLAIVSAMIDARMPPPTRDGVAATGGYDPTTGRHASTLGDTAAIIGDDGDQGCAPNNMPIMTGVYGDQYGVRGGERTKLIPTQSGLAGIFVHDVDDSPGAPPGEVWRTHRDASGTVNAWLKFLNDGVGSDDGGVDLLAGTQLVLRTADGTEIVIASGVVSVGASGLDPTQDAAVSQRYLQDGLEALRTAVQTAFTTLCARIQSGTGVAPPMVADVTAQGSSVVKLAQ